MFVLVSTLPWAAVFFTKKGFDKATRLKMHCGTTGEVWIRYRSSWSRRWIVSHNFLLWWFERSRLFIIGGLCSSIAYDENIVFVLFWLVIAALFFFPKWRLHGTPAEGLFLLLDKASLLMDVMLTAVSSGSTIRMSHLMAILITIVPWKNFGSWAVKHSSYLTKHLLWMANLQRKLVNTLLSEQFSRRGLALPKSLTNTSGKQYHRAWTLEISSDR